jgi:hypothetical protein
LLTCQKFKENRCRTLTALLLMILDNFSSSASGARVAVPSHKGEYLQVTEVQTCKNILNNFFKKIPEFWFSPPKYCVYLKIL